MIGLMAALARYGFAAYSAYWVATEMGHKINDLLLPVARALESI